MQTMKNLRNRLVRFKIALLMVGIVLGQSTVISAYADTYGNLPSGQGQMFSQPQVGPADCNPSQPYSPACMNPMNNGLFPSSNNPDPNMQYNSSTLSFDTSMLGGNSPLTLSLRDDDNLGVIAGLNYVRSLNQNNAADILVDGGENEFRANLTYGHAFSPNQQIKLTYEFLAQNQGYDFQSGTVNQWDSQNAFGADYRYIFNKGILNSIDFTGDYIHAQSQSLPTVLFQDDNGNWAYDYRNIAGGTEEDAGASVTLLPGANTSVTIGAGYSGIKYPTRYSQADNTSTLAYQFNVTHVMNDTNEISASLEHDADSNTYSVEYNHLLAHHVEAGVSLNYSQGLGGLPSDHSVLVALSYPAPRVFSPPSPNKINDLSNWVKTPVVYENQILAVADEKVVQATISNGSLGTQTVPVGTEMQLDLKPLFNFTQSQFDIVTFTESVQPQAAGGNLYLETEQNGDYDANLVSTQPMPAYAVNPGQYTVTITAQGFKGNRVIATSTNSFQLVVTTNASDAPSWKSFNLGTAKVGSAYSFNLNSYVTNPVNGGNYTISSSNLPSWLTLNNGELSGTPTANSVGTTNINFTVSNQGGGSNQIQEPLTVNANQGTAPSFNPSLFNLGITNVGSPYSMDMSKQVINGGNNFTMTAENVPAGLTFSNGGSGDYMLSGIPTTAGIANIKFTVTNSFGTNSTTLPLDIGNIPQWQTGFINQNAFGGTQYYPDLHNPSATSVDLSQYVTYKTGSETYTMGGAKGGSVPTWLTLNGSILSAGTPSLAENGKSYAIWIQVQNKYGSTIFYPTINVNAPHVVPTWNNNTFLSSINALVGAEYNKGSSINLNQYVTDSSGGAHTFTITQQPSWLNASTTSDGTLVFSAKSVPSVNDLPPSTSSIEITVSNSYGSSSTTQTINVVPNPSLAPTWASFDLGTANAGSPYSFNLNPYVTNPANGGDYTISSIDLPSWLTLNNGVISGTPPNNAHTTYVVFMVSNPGGGSNAIEKPITITYVTTPGFKSFNLATATIGQKYSYDLSQDVTNGGSNYTISATGLPSWLSLNGTVLSGTPTQVGTNQGLIFTVKNSAGSGQSSPESLTVQTNSSWAPKFTGNSLPAVTVGASYSQDLSKLVSNPANGGTLTFAVSNLPPGLNFDGNSIISGTPTAANAYSIQVTAINTNGGATPTTPISLTVNVNPSLLPTFNTTTLPIGMEFAPYKVDLSTIINNPKGGGTLIITVDPKTLPQGLSFSGTVISGTPATSGNFNILVTASNTNGGQPQSPTPVSLRIFF